MGQLPPNRKANATVFACGDRSHLTSDVIDAAQYRSELTPVWDRLQQRVAAEEDAAERELEPDGDAIQEMSDEFRSERDLITAEETELWLE